MGDISEQGLLEAVQVNVEVGADGLERSLLQINLVYTPSIDMRLGVAVVSCVRGPSTPRTLVDSRSFNSNDIRSMI